MQLSSVILLVASAATVFAQNYPTFDKEDIDEATRQYWCEQQTASCGPLCNDQESGIESKNSCDPETLVFECECTDGKVPNATQYSQTIPYFICTTQVEACANACTLSDNKCVSDCREKKPCGASSPKRVNKTETTSASSTATSDPDVVYNGLGGDSASKSGNDSTSSNGGGLLKSAASHEFFGFAAMVTALFVSTFAILL